MTRRDLILTSAATASVLSAQTDQKVQRKNRIKQGVCGGVFGREMSFEDRCRHAARLGAHCYDLVQPAQWEIVKKYGLLPAFGDLLRDSAKSGPAKP